MSNAVATLGLKHQLPLDSAEALAKELSLRLEASVAASDFATGVELFVLSHPSPRYRIDMLVDTPTSYKLELYAPPTREGDLNIYRDYMDFFGATGGALWGWLEDALYRGRIGEDESSLYRHRRASQALAQFFGCEACLYLPDNSYPEARIWDKTMEDIPLEELLGYIRSQGYLEPGETLEKAVFLDISSAMKAWQKHPLAGRGLLAEDEYLVAIYDDFADLPPLEEPFPLDGFAS